MWGCTRHYLGYVYCAIRGPSWIPQVISTLGDVRVKYPSRFFRSKINLGHWETLPFRMTLQKELIVFYHARITPTPLFPSMLMLPWIRIWLPVSCNTQIAHGHLLLS